MNEMIEIRLWKHVARAAAGECWPWTGHTTASRGGGTRYGAIRVGSTMQKAHRVAWALSHGPIPAGQVVRHKCDNSICCNPNHLELGTQADNIRDREERGRGVRLCGARHARAKLTEQQVREIRSLKGEGQSIRSLGRRYGVSSYAIMHATKYGWKHI